MVQHCLHEHLLRAPVVAAPVVLEVDSVRIVTAQVRLEMICTMPSCPVNEGYDSFTNYTEKEALRAARKAGWVTRRNHEVCPKCVRKREGVEV
jgi:hypothetical protein